MKVLICLAVAALAVACADYQTSPRSPAGHAGFDCRSGFILIDGICQPDTTGGGSGLSQPQARPKGQTQGAQGQQGQ